MGHTASFLSDKELPKVPLILEGVSARFIRESRIVPLELKNNTFKVLMADPTDRAVIDALSVSLEAEVQAYGGDAKAIDDYIARYYGPDQQDISKIIGHIDDRVLEGAEGEDDDVGRLKDLAAEAPIIRLVNLLITRALEGRASDIHIEPFEEELRIRYRIDGVLQEIERMPRKLQAAIVSRIKVMAKLDIAERRLPQDGRIRIKAAAREIDLRVSTMPVIDGEGVVMRILDRESIVIDLTRLGFPDAMLRRFQRLIARPNGIVLVTGPTGSGKTTTLYGALEKINSPEVKIITVEDPVEYQIRGVNQIQVKPQIGLTFAAALRHMVRHDPDVIMIGEIRDLETAEIAVQSALTGHLVFSTLHTNDAPSAMTRLLDLGVEPFLLSSTIRGILAQRLVRVICPHCREADPAAESPETLAHLGIASPPGLFRGRGCEACAFTGYHGRSGIFELLVVDEEMRRLILRGADAQELRERAREKGMTTMLEDGALKAARGMTTLREVFRVTQEA